MTQLPLTPGAQPGSDGFRTVNPTAANAAIGRALRIASISGNVATTEWYSPGSVGVVESFIDIILLNTETINCIEANQLAISAVESSTTVIGI